MNRTRLNINWGQHRWAIFFCAVSSLGALCYGYDQIYYTGVLGMKRFVHDYGTTDDKNGNIALTTTFISLTASIIYVGELVGALIAAPINDSFGRKGVFLCASVCIIAGAVVQVADQGSMGVICLGRILIGLGIGQVSRQNPSRSPPFFSAEAPICQVFLLLCRSIQGSSSMNTDLRIVHRDVPTIHWRSGTTSDSWPGAHDVSVHAVLLTAGGIRHHQGH
jgi:MFS family permease